MGQNIIQSLLLKIEASNAELHTKLKEAQEDIFKFKEYIEELGKTLVGLFATEKLVEYGKELIELTQEFGELHDTAKEFFETLTNNDVNKSASVLQSLSENLGTDFKENLLTAKQLTVEFGLSFEQATDIIKKGSVVNKSQAELYLQTLKQYGGVFKTMGLDASQASAVISGALKSGFGGEALTALQKAQKSILDFTPEIATALANVGVDVVKLTDKISSGSITQFQALQLVSEKIKELGPNSIYAQSVVDKVFGKAASAFRPFIDSLGEANTDLEKMVEDLGGAEKTTLKLIDSQASLDKTLLDLFQHSKEGWLEFKISMVDALNTSIKEVSGFLKGIKDTYNESILFRLVWQVIGLNIKLTWDIFKGFFNFGYNAISTLIKLVKDLFTLNWKEGLKNLKDGFNDTIQGLEKSGKEMGEDVFKAWDNTMKKFTFVDVAKTEEEGKKAGEVAGVAFKAEFERNAILDDYESAYAKRNKSGAISGVKTGKVDTSIISDDDIAKVNKHFDIMNSKATQFTKTISTTHKLFQEMGTSFDVVVSEQIVKGLDGIEKAFDELAAGGKSAFKDLVTATLDGLRQIINGLLAVAIANQIKNGVATGGNPITGLVLASIGVAGVETLWKKLVPAFADGGITSGGLSLVGERGSELIATMPGQRVFNAQDTSRILGGGNGGGRISIDDVIVDGDKLRYILKYNDDKHRRI